MSSEGFRSRPLIAIRAVFGEIDMRPTKAGKQIERGSSVLNAA